MSCGDRVEYLGLGCKCLPDAAESPAPAMTTMCLLLRKASRNFSAFSGFWGSSAIDGWWKLWEELSLFRPAVRGVVTVQIKGFYRQTSRGVLWCATPRARSMASESELVHLPFPGRKGPDPEDAVGVRKGRHDGRLCNSHCAAGVVSACFHPPCQPGRPRCGPASPRGWRAPSPKMPRLQRPRRQRRRYRQWRDRARCTAAHKAL